MSFRARTHGYVLQASINRLLLVLPHGLVLLVASKTLLNRVGAFVLRLSLRIRHARNRWIRFVRPSRIKNLPKIFRSTTTVEENIARSLKPTIGIGVPISAVKGTRARSAAVSFAVLMEIDELVESSKVDGP